jgi:hypothetical protein
MPKPTSEIARECLQAYVNKDRAACEALVAPDFRFTSPMDNALDRETYFKTCWPNSEAMTACKVVQTVDIRDQAYITYEAQAAGRTFCNTELHIYFCGKVHGRSSHRASPSPRLGRKRRRRLLTTSVLIFVPRCLMYRSFHGKAGHVRFAPFSAIFRPALWVTAIFRAAGATACDRRLSRPSARCNCRSRLYLYHQRFCGRPRAGFRGTLRIGRPKARSRGPELQRLDRGRKGGVDPDTNSSRRARRRCRGSRSIGCRSSICHAVAPVSARRHSFVQEAPASRRLASRRWTFRPGGRLRCRVSLRCRPDWCTPGTCA